MGIMPVTKPLKPPALKVKPPFIFFIPLLLGVLLNVLYLSPFLENAFTALVLGVLLVMLGFAFVRWAVSVFDAHEVSRKFKPVGTLVKTGPYAMTRNPMYVGLTLMYLGVSIASNAWLPILFLPFILVFLYYYVIVKEEAYLAGLFGKEYAAYKASVRRWL